MKILKLSDLSERTYDSCLPPYSLMVPGTLGLSAYKYKGEAADRVAVDTSVVYEQTLQTSIIEQFPFKNDPQRNLEKKGTEMIYDSVFNNPIGSYPEFLTGVQLDNLDTVIYRTGYSYLSNAESSGLYQFATEIMYPLNPPAVLDLRDNLVSSYRAPSSISYTWEDYKNGYDIDLDPRGTLLYPVLKSLDQPWESTLYPLASSLSFTATTTSATVRYGSTTVDIDDHKMVNYVASPTSDVPFSISVIFKTSKAAGLNTQIIAERFSTTKREWEVYLNSNLTPVFRIGSDNTSNIKGIVSATPVVTDEWVHMVVTYNGDGGASSTATSSMKMYINGELMTDTTTSGGGYTGLINSDSASRLWVGAHNSGGAPSASSEFEGLIWTLNIWKNRELSAVEAGGLYRAEMFTPGKGFVRHRTGYVGIDGNPTSGTFRYGISNVEPEYASSLWRVDHYGHVRDMLEPRRQFTDSNEKSPIKIAFTSGSVKVDPMLTYSQNLSVFATSSMPYFDDGIARNRPDDPDETLVEVVA